MCLSFISCVIVTWVSSSVVVTNHEVLQIQLCAALWYGMACDDMISNSIFISVCRSTAVTVAVPNSSLHELLTLYKNKDATYQLTKVPKLISEQQTD